MVGADFDGKNVREQVYRGLAAAVVRALPARADVAAAEEMFTIALRVRATIRQATARQQNMGPRVLTAKTRSHSASSISRSGLFG